MKGYHPLSTLLSPAIIESLHRTGGVIDESIKVITHSMGGAYGKGYVKAILEYAKENNIAGVTIAFEADFVPFQPGMRKQLTVFLHSNFLIMMIWLQEMTKCLVLKR